MSSITTNSNHVNQQQNTTDSIINVSGIKPEVYSIGQEQTPVIIIDNFADDLFTLLDIARQQVQFTKDDGSYYPGVRAPLPQRYAIEVINQVFQLIYDVYRVPHHLRIKPQILSFSLISQAPDSLMPLQRLPHFDTPEPYYFAILHYLNDGPHGNTAFFRHKNTGFERINEARMEHYFTSAKAFLTDHAKDTPEYFVKSDQHYDIYHQIEYRPNRLVIYPGNMLHSTLVDLRTDIDDNPNTGRLTANIFINFK
ncbi:DUF6445 family protein [Shewanella sp. ULN5]|jgi:hypothetical protein|uniref:DUF6445 family protein n=1 Tax=Shewanella sp. ULN5 TaxID=2994678 RepID=UPI00273E4269|nr:DUF6445 family protein [Shewanella sp. ULN5]MDP5146778.1 DUF6445 family protein [Shewanella sp. ULN5]